MRIGLFTDTYHPAVNGITYVVEITKRELEALGHEVYVFAPTPQLRKYRELEKNVIRFPAIKDLFFEGQFTTMFFPPRAIKKIKSLNLDIIHFFTPGQIGLLGSYAAIKNKTPLVAMYSTDLYEYVTHYPVVFPGMLALTMTAPIALKSRGPELKKTLSALTPKRNVEAWSQNLVSEMITLLHNRCAAVIVPSIKVQKQLLEWQTESPIYLIPTGVDALKTDKQLSQRLKKRFDIGVGDKIILYVGRLGSEKNIDLLINSFSLIKNQVPEAKFLIVGSGPHKAALESLTSTRLLTDSVIFTGSIERRLLGSVYALASIFIFASMTDTQGLVLNEAAHAGLPLVITDPEISEVVQNGQNGFYAQNNPQDLAQKVTSIIKDPQLAARMSNASFKISVQFNERGQTEKLVTIYNKIIDQD